MRFHVILLFLILLFPSSNRAQEVCKSNTEDISKAKGIKATLYYPCEWSYFDIKRPNTIFFYGEGAISLSHSMNCLIADYTTTSDNLEAYNISGSVFIREFYNKIPLEIRSERKLMINGLACKEFVFELTENTPTYVSYHKKLSYFFVVNGKLINLNYQVIGADPSIVKEDFAKNVRTFRELANYSTFSL